MPYAMPCITYLCLLVCRFHVLYALVCSSGILIIKRIARYGSLFVMGKSDRVLFKYRIHLRVLRCLYVLSQLAGQVEGSKGLTAWVRGKERGSGCALVWTWVGLGVLPGGKEPATRSGWGNAQRMDFLSHVTLLPSVTIPSSVRTIGLPEGPVSGTE